MATVKGPLFSIDASGTVGGAIVYSTWKGRSYVRSHAVPANPRTAGQLSVRAMMQFLTQFWASLSAVQQATWETRAAVTNISPFNAYIQYNMLRWGTDQVPGQTDPAEAGDVAGVIDNGNLTQGSRSLLIEVEVTTLNQNWGILVYRDPAADLAGVRNEMVHVMPAAAAEVFTWLDFPLTAGTTYYYRAKSFSEDGLAGNLLGEWHGVPDP